MVKIVFASNNINDVFEGDISLAISDHKTKATYTDDTTDGSLTFFGENFKRLGDTELLSGGTVEKLIVKDENGDLAATLTGANVKAQDLSNGFIADGLMGMLAVLLGGKDEIIGSGDDDQLYGFGKNDEISGRKGEDLIVGGKGDDTMTGGADADTFYFAPADDGKGDDTITDFDVKGEVVDAFALSGEQINRIAKQHQNHDTLLTLGDGSTILLLDVTKAEFAAYLQAIVV